MLLLSSSLSRTFEQNDALVRVGERDLDSKNATRLPTGATVSNAGNDESLKTLLLAII